ncbi:alcohol dehydrogenase catalytic domain-containing protein [Leucobacter denitrificans]|uniref:Alcohol dehydrogenase catalytic domain-containing protein n=1 Tax=Leucobacter denitrificans TaxID=683042 RepID=A0A7G9S381_9MICO|nr:alcohol dehydrogenase catalytic domain-containing protein [Leucobacter denitrificans]QNN62306.1 alcohol dehydrogenase catalytic domain-containing protein [Leucobacter denitrificans]
MKAVILSGPEQISVEEVDTPTVQFPTDAIVKVSHSAVCGADLLPFHGHTPGFEFGMIPGHEFVGEVVEVGSEVDGISVGDRVVNTSMTSCGTCSECAAERWTQCTTRSLFGYSGVYPKLDGGQAEYVRVPNAARSLLALPEEVSSEDALFLADILPTGYAGVDNAGVTEGDLLVVQGAGPVGLMAVIVALSRGARVVVVDGVDARRELATELGATAITPQEARDYIDTLTDGVGADCVIEASGSIPALKDALHLARPQGIISVIGAHFENDFPLDNGVMFEKELTLKFNIGNPFKTRELLLEAIRRGELKPGRVLTHVLPADDAVEAYTKFDNKEFTKVALTY